MYRGVFTVGFAVLQGNNFNSANALTDYSFINARDGNPNNVLISRCMTGLGPSGNDNGVLGGWYFNSNRIPNRASCSSNIIQPVPGGALAGANNIFQCIQFTTAAEGVYTCTMMNSSMVDQSVRVGIYFSSRSESLDLYISSLNHLSSLYTAAPVIDPISPNTMTVNVGDPLTLSCTSRGSPPDTFTWRKDNGPTILQSTSITALDHTSTSAVFRADYSIDSVTTSDSGTYTCIVTNPIGSDSATIIIACKLLT